MLCNTYSYFMGAGGAANGVAATSTPPHAFVLHCEGKKGGEG